MPDPDTEVSPLPATGDALTSLVRRQPDEPFALTTQRETDDRGAIVRALREYLETLSIDWIGGRSHRFAAVVDTWADAEETNGFPAAVVQTSGPGQYEAHQPNPQDLGDGYVLIKVGELELGVAVLVWANDKHERMALSAMLQDAFDPVEWMTGFQLRCPHYHGAVVGVQVTSGPDYQDDPTEAQARRRKLAYELKCTVPRFRLHAGVPRAKLRLQVEVEDSQ